MIRLTDKVGIFPAVNIINKQRNRKVQTVQENTVPTYSSVIENFNPVSLQQTADLFLEHVLQGSFRFFFQCRILFFSMQKTLYCCCSEFNVICGESPRRT